MISRLRLSSPVVREARLVSTSCRFLLLTPCNVPAYTLETGLPENLRASRREGRPGTLLAKLSVVQDGRQADICPVAWDIVWGFILLDFGCKKDIFYIEIIGFMVYLIIGIYFFMFYEGGYIWI